MKKYFITGGLGFIGYHLTKRLLNEGNEVVIYDAQKHYIPFDKSNWSFYQNYRIANLKRQGLTIIRGDCTDRGWLNESLETHKPDVIIHLAALSIAGISNDYPAEAKLNIFDGTVILLDLLRTVSFSFDRFIYTSSSMVYGNFMRDQNNQIIPAVEEQKCNPIDLYGAMKLSGEHIVKVYNHRFNVPFSIIRPSAVYGPTDCNRRVTEVYLMNALLGKELLLDNGGQHELDFTYVDDIVNGFMLAATSEKALGETFNITRGEGRKISDLAEVIKGLIPETKIALSDHKPYRPNRGALDISKARTLLGYEPAYSLDEGMRKYLGFIRETGVPGLNG